MPVPQLMNGLLYTPYRIYIRSFGYFSDADLLQLFGLHGYHRMSVTTRHPRHAVVAHDGEWTMLADDWYYTLWHMPTTRPAIATLGESWDVFACSVGDCDPSFDFVYHQGSKLVRQHVVEYPQGRGRVVTVDEGDPLPGEAFTFTATDELAWVLSIARSLNIRTEYNERDIRVYALAEPDRR